MSLECVRLVLSGVMMGGWVRWKARIRVVWRRFLLASSLRCRMKSDFPAKASASLLLLLLSSSSFFMFFLGSLYRSSFSAVCLAVRYIVGRVECLVVCTW